MTAQIACRRAVASTMAGVFAAILGFLIVMGPPTTAAAQQQCGPLGALGVVQCSGPYPGGIEYTGVAGDVSATLNAGAQALDTILLQATGNVGLVAAAGTDILSSTGPGVAATATGVVNVAVQNVTTTADNAAGLLLDGTAGVVATTAGLVSTSGDSSPAIEAQSDGSIAITSNILRTSGDDAAAVEAVTVSGPISLEAVQIETLGTSSAGALLEAAGDINVDVGVLRTEGGQAAGLNLTTDAAACVLLSAGSCDVTAAAEEITTGGFGGVGALVRAAGDVGLGVDVLQTEGGQAAGFDIATSPSACVVLGVGACDTVVDIGNLSTLGDGSIAGLVRATGDTTVNIDVLRTQGGNAAGLDLAADPTACAVLGTGACDTAFSVGDLRTFGANSPGAVVRGAGDVTGNVTLLRTEGSDAAGVDLSASPTVCALLGRGGCDTAFTANDLLTLGDRSPGALIRGFGDIAANVGVLRTQGDDAAGLDIAADPAACVLLGAGACSVTAVGDQIITEGAGSQGALIRAAGPVLADFNLLQTGGDDAAGLDILLDPVACATLGVGQCQVIVDAEEVDTGGDNSPGVDVDSPGPVVVDVGDVETGGANSPGVNVDGDDAPVTVVAGPVTTTAQTLPAYR